MVKKKAVCCSFIQQTFSEHVLCVRHWGYKNEQKNTALGLVEFIVCCQERDEKQTNKQDNARNKCYGSTGKVGHWEGHEAFQESPRKPHLSCAEEGEQPACGGD